MKSQSRNLLFFLDQISKPHCSLALTDLSGLVYFLKYETLADIGTMGFAAKTAHHYLNLKVGDVAILNDPYSGGTILSTMSLITPVSRKKEENLLLVIRVGFKPNIIITNKIEEEGVRIPPTPIAQNGVVNEIILEAIGSHPLAPEAFTQRLKTEIENILKLSKKLSQLHDYGVADLTQKNLASYLADCKELILEKMNELPELEIQVDSKLDAGEIIHAKIIKSESKINIDFRNTSASQNVCLTDMAAFGTCLGALHAFFDGGFPCNSASMELIEVSSPLGCMLNAKYPSATFKGMTDGCNMVASTILKGFTQFNQKKMVAFSGVAMSKIQLTFADGKKFYDYLPGGTGALPDKDGSDGLSYWSRNNLEPSIEEIERRFPLIIRRVSLRQASGGKGLFKGGNGLFKQFELLSPAKMSWHLDQTKQTPSGVLGAQDAAPGELFVYHKKKLAKENLDSTGHIELQNNDTISLLSGGGGGWGKAEN